MRFWNADNIDALTLCGFFVHRSHFYIEFLNCLDYSKQFLAILLIEMLRFSRGRSTQKHSIDVTAFDALLNRSVEFNLCCVTMNLQHFAMLLIKLLVYYSANDNIFNNSEVVSKSPNNKTLVN